MSSVSDLNTRYMATTNYDNTLCVLCHSGDNAELMLLCDGCDKGFHTSCMNIPAVPVGDWYCPACRREAAAPQARCEIRQGLGVFLYERVSSAGQHAPEYGRVGMETQNNVLLEYALKNGLVICGTAREVGSARNPSKLAELNRICKTIKRGQCVLVYSVSRFSRNLAQGREMAFAIHNAGGWVYSVSENVTSFDQRFLQILQQAQAESDRLSQKMLDANARIRAHGGHVGPAPYGSSTYRDQQFGVRRLTPNAHEQQTLVTLRAVYDEEIQRAPHYGALKRTAERLNAIGELRRGRPWNRNTVKKSLGSLVSDTFSRDLRSALF